MAKNYWIDHSDPPFPQIRHQSHPEFDDRFHELMALTQARAEIKIICRQHRQHWLAVMNYQLSQSPESIIQEAKQARELGPTLKQLLAEEMTNRGEPDA